MQKLLGLFIWILCLPVGAEQNLFNVPSSELTKSGKIFFDEQINYANSLAQSNSTFCYGLPGDMEFGFDILNLDIPFTKEAPPSIPLLVVNFQKLLFSSDHFRIAWGNQLGTALFESRAKPAFFSYLNTVTTLGADLLKIYLGGFFANTYYLNSQETFQFMAGLEVPILLDKLHFMADHIHGQHVFGVSVVGTLYFVNPELAISGGIQIPNEGSNNSTAAVIDFTWR